MLRVKATASKVEAILGYTFINKLLCAEAVQMAGPRATVNVEDGDSFASKFRQVDNNKRLAVLGDAVLAKLLCEEWYQTTDANGTYPASGFLPAPSPNSYLQAIDSPSATGR